MKGIVYPRPSVKDPKTGKRRPIPGKSTWTYQFMVKRNGRRVTISEGGHRTKTLAEGALTEALEAYKNKPGASEPSKMLFGDYLQREWLPVVATSKKPSTYATYRHFVEGRIIPALGDVRLHELTTGDLLGLYSTLRKGGRRDTKAGGLSERTIKQVHCIISAALRHATESGIVIRNVAATIARDARPTPRKTEMRTWTAAELRTFLESVRDDRLHACFAFAATTGLRRSELLALRWQDVDIASGQVSVRRGRVAVGADVHEGTPKSGHARTVAIDDEIVALLKRHRTAQLEERMRAGDTWTDTGRVFTAEDGNAMRPGHLTQTFDRRAKRAGVPVIRLHDLRHTHATLLLAGGAHPKVVQERLGHSSV